MERKFRVTIYRWIEMWPNKLKKPVLHAQELYESAHMSKSIEY